MPFLVTAGRQNKGSVSEGQGDGAGGDATRGWSPGWGQVGPLARRLGDRGCLWARGGTAITLRQGCQPAWDGEGGQGSLAVVEWPPRGGDAAWGGAWHLGTGPVTT